MEILCSKYRIYRRDRESNVRKTGGGILIAVSTEIPSEQILIQHLNGIEIVMVKVLFRNMSFLISCSYIPPSSDDETYARHVSAISSAFQYLSASDTLVVLGDFNIPSASWLHSSESNSLIPIISNNNISNNFLNSLLNLGLFQINNIFNSHGKLLDLVFVNDTSNIRLESFHALTKPEDLYHPTLIIHVAAPNSLRSRITGSKKEYCFAKTNYNMLNSLLSAIVWDDILDSGNITELSNRFYSVLQDCISKSVPRFTVDNNSGPPWKTRVLMRLKNRKNKMFRKFKKSGSSLDFSNYSIARSKYNLENKLAHRNYLSRMKEQLRVDPKSFYKFVNSKRQSNTQPTYLKYQSLTADNDMDISDLFAEFFATTYSDRSYDCSNTYPFITRSFDRIDFSYVHETTVLDNLRTLKSSYNAGPDGIPSCILKLCADKLSYPLSLLFNSSLKSGVLPDIWKRSYIIPLYKSGDRNDVCNYRGISNLSAIPKLMEKILTNSITHQISSLLSTSQHGFRRKRSTITNLLEFTCLVNDAFRNRLQTDTIYTDFSKAFDKVNHALLLRKLDMIGFSNSLLKWFQSYLIGRTQCVKFGNATSRYVSVTSGVPQGSHLGPVLFCLFINDLPSIIKYSNILMFADDVKLFRSFNDPVDQYYLQIDLDNFSNWCELNLMELNTSKCKLMRFSRGTVYDSSYIIGSTRLEAVDSFKDLGLLMDQRLNFRQHISMAISKAYVTLGFMKRWSKEFRDYSVTKILYTTLVRSHLEYGSIIWDPYYTIHSDKIESVQKQFLLFCLRHRGWDPQSLPSYEFRLNLIKLPSLSSRRTMLNICYIMNIIQGEIESEFLLNRLAFNIPIRPTRNFEPLKILYHRTNFANNDPFRRLCAQFNKYFNLIDLSENRVTLKRNIILHLNR
ncbi:uncharacterized protein LOC142240069 [Haematobia irritans]|uniref:uncharacterized protein LOC142240069 n=1 Tax=Haematobia irritans TaxID=7368 RepID=UPI003F4F9329